MDIRIMEEAKTNIGPSGNHMYQWKLNLDNKIIVSGKINESTPTFAFESESLTREIRKWEEDVEAEHVELFRP